MTGHNLFNTFGAQADFQRHINAHPEDIEDPQELIDYIVYMKTALDDELHEMLNETGWKPWATSRHINMEGMKSELVDAFQFFMNLCFAAKMDANELMIRHADKLQKNYERAANGYDGVSTKCGWCGRALDDTYVYCAQSTEGKPHYCSQKAQEELSGFFTEADLEMKE